jgi:hypothetical protein
MPRACPVEFHASCYKELAQATGCHGLAPWSLALTAVANLALHLKSACGSNSVFYIVERNRGGERDAPRDKPVASIVCDRSL